MKESASKEDLNKYYKIDNYYSVNHYIADGWHKYTIGKFNDYKQADDLKNSLNNKVKEPFVVAFKNGVEIQIERAIELLNK